jgi:hypothetical protein
LRPVLSFHVKQTLRVLVSAGKLSLLSQYSSDSLLSLHMIMLKTF